MIMKCLDVSVAEMSCLIDNWIYNERDRAIMKRRFCDGITYARLAEEFDMSERQIKRICYKNFDKVLNHIK